MCELADLHRKGEGVKQDPEEALGLFRLAAEKGHAEALYGLGCVHSQGIGGVAQDYTEAARLWRLAADQGHAISQFNLGNAYRDGEGVEQDYKEAAKWYTLASDQGFADAQGSLGGLYLEGCGVEQDFDKAFALLRLASAQGHAEAASMLSQCYKYGWGVKKNLNMAKTLAYKAADTQKRPSHALQAAKMTSSRKNKLARLQAALEHPKFATDMAMSAERKAEARRMHAELKQDKATCGYRKCDNNEKLMGEFGSCLKCRGKTEVRYCSKDCQQKAWKRQAIVQEAQERENKSNKIFP
jgi:TPR repeat protein